MDRTLVMVLAASVGVGCTDTLGLDLGKDDASRERGVDASMAGGEAGRADDSTSPDASAGAALDATPSVEHDPFDAGRDPERNRIEPGQVCTRLAQVLCAGEAACCNAPGRDRSACEEAQRDLCARSWFLDAVSLDPVSGFDPAGAEEAFAEIERRAAACDPDIADYNISTDGLRGIFQGTRPPDSNCSPANGAASSVDSWAIMLSSCTPIETTSCLPVADVSFAAWTCATRGDVGAPCSSYLNCRDGLACPSGLADSDFQVPYGLAGFRLATCTARKVDGETCAAGDECTSLYCIDGACAPATVQTAYCLARQNRPAP